MAAPASTNEEQSATFKLTKLKKKGTGDAHLGSITCVDWTAALPNRLMSGSEDKFIKVWDIRTQRSGITLDLTTKGEISDIASHSCTIWASASDCKVYEFDTRMIRQKKEIDHFLECKDEISQICYDHKSNHLFIGDDAGKVTKYDLTAKKVTESVCFHDNALCTSVTTIPELNIGFCGGTDATLYQFNSTQLSDAFAYSMQDLIAKHESTSNGAKSQLTVNPPFIYSLDSKVLQNTDDVKQGLIAMALGNGNIALYAPTLHSGANGKSKDDVNGDEKQEEEEHVVDDPVCCVEMHQSAVSDVSFGYGNDWLVSAGTDKFLMINEWTVNSENNGLSIESKFRIPLKEKPNSMVCTGNEVAQIVVADLSNNLSMYALKS